MAISHPELTAEPYHAFLLAFLCADREITTLQSRVLERLGLIPKCILLPPMQGLMCVVGVMEDYRVFLLESESP